VAFVSAPAVAFAVRGIATPEDALQAGGSVSWSFARDFAMYAHLDGWFAEDDQYDVSAVVGARYLW
jgi:hypothetical protein